MKRRFQSAADSDSLELLLDTLCNVFGGIVLIACLLAILPRQNQTSPMLPSEDAVAAMIERRSIYTEEEITRVMTEMDQLESTTDPALAELQARRDSLRRVHERLRREINEGLTKESSEAEARAISSQGDLYALAERLEDLKLLRSMSEGAESATAEKIRFLDQRLENLREESIKLVNGRTQAVRFARERPGEDSPSPVILRFNAVYPLVLGVDFEENPAIDRAPTGADSFRADPIRGRGIVHPSADRFLIATLELAREKGQYVTLYLYPDSHEVFGEFKEALSKAKISYGLEFVSPERSLSFGSKGSMPPKL